MTRYFIFRSNKPEKNFHILRNFTKWVDFLLNFTIGGSSKWRRSASVEDGEWWSEEPARCQWRTACRRGDVLKIHQAITAVEESIANDKWINPMKHQSPFHAALCALSLVMPLSAEESMDKMWGDKTILELR
jgi:hypothetical protein